MNKNLNCMVCNSSLKPILKRDDGYFYHKCESCLLITTIPHPSDQTISTYYDGFLFRKPEGKEIEERKRLLAKDVAKISRDIRKFKAGESISLLDFGGGTGFYSNAFQEEGFNVTLLDVDSQACDYVKDTFPSLNVLCLNPMIQTTKSKFDVVFCNQVIEHYKDSDALLSTLNSFLKEDGLLIVTTPNSSSKEYLFRPAWIWDYIKPTSDKTLKRLLNFFHLFINSWISCDPPRHIYAFNAKNLKDLHERNDLKVEKVFTEYVISQYYSLKKYNDFSLKGIRSFFKIAQNIYAWVGISMLRLLDFKNNLGNNLVFYSRKK
tara:strand:+ start:222 stop:1181 length:960 start_codon:yes stop_codon:yes gene_type:complete